MTRTFATATAIATALIAISPAADAGQMINGPTPQVNVAPNVLRPQTNLSAVTPSPEVRRVLKQGEADDDSGNDDSGNGDRAGAKDQPENTGEVAEQPPRNERTEALTDRAPVPPDFPVTLVKAMERPPFKPWDKPHGEAKPGPAPTGEGDADDGHADHLGDAGEIDTDGAGDDSVGTGNNPPLGENDADRLREQFRGGVGVEKAEQLARLKELQEHGWLEFGEGAFAGDGDCGPGVNLPAGTDLPGLGCDSSENAPGPSTDPRGDGGVTFPFDPRHEGGHYPRPSPDDGMGGNREHPGAWISSGGGSAKGDAGVKDFGQGRAQGNWGASPAQLRAAGFHNVETSDDGDTITAHGMDQSGNPVFHKQTRQPDGGVKTVTITDHDDGHTRTTCVTGVCETHEHFDEPNSEPDMEFDLEETEGSDSGGDAGRSDPRGDPQGGGGASGDCLMLGTRCDVAEGESGETWGEKMKEWARTNGLGGGSLTPGRVMEQAGQPVPVPGRDSATGEVADPRTEAGLTPGCDAGPGGCAGGGDGGVAGSEVAGAAADDALDEASVDGSIAGMTPGCDASPDGCGGGSTGAAAEAGVESGAGEAAR